jgi:hypothetical protein
VVRLAAVLALATAQLVSCANGGGVATPSTTTATPGGPESTTEAAIASTVVTAAPPTTVLVTTVPPDSPADLASVDIRIGDALEGRGHCQRGPVLPLDPNIGMPEIGVEGCPRVREVIGLDEQTVYDRLQDWEIRTMYRDIPLDWEDNLDRNRISLFVVDGVIVDARWA